MRYVTFYHKTTGILCGKSVLSSSDEGVRINTPEDHIAIDHPDGGNLDHLSQRVDPSTGALVEYQPPQPSNDHEWDNRSKRWRLRIELAARLAARNAALAEIGRLEQSQGRAVREALLGQGVDRLREIEERIAELRKSL